MVKTIVGMEVTRISRQLVNTSLVIRLNFVATKLNVLMRLTFATVNVIVSMGQMRNPRNVTRSTARQIRNSCAR